MVYVRISLERVQNTWRKDRWTSRVRKTEPVVRTERRRKGEQGRGRVEVVTTHCPCRKAVNVLGGGGDRGVVDETKSTGGEVPLLWKNFSDNKGHCDC